MADRIVDLRSDTITQPTEEMWEAMRRAEVGDDVYGEDPTVRRLEELAASRLGMDTAVYVPTGTMGNTAALMAHTHAGDEVIFEELAHMYCWEAGGYASLGGLAARCIRGEHGVIAADQLEAAIRPENPHFPQLTALCLENTHNNAAGSCWLPEEMAAVCEVAHRHGLAVHLDGARIFNAAVATGRDASEFARHVDSVMFCVSKGLSAPVGSLVCGGTEVIDRVRRMRKRLGGGMRQAGVVAAAGIVALESMVDRLADDHANARALSEGLAAIDGIGTTLAPRPTNIAMVHVGDLGWTSAELIERWGTAGIRCNARPPSSVRVVTNRHVTAEDIGYVLEVTRDLVAGQ